jgi:hypothetical protein
MLAEMMKFFLIFAFKILLILRFGLATEEDAEEEEEEEEEG